MWRSLVAFAFLLRSLSPLSAVAEEILRVAAISPLSGPFALVGEETVKQIKGAADLVNAKGGIFDGRKIEVVALDGKANPQDSLLAQNAAIDGGIHYVVAHISSVNHALSDAIVKHNARNPDRRVLLLNFDGRDPALTEAKCNFWHFRVNYHTDTEVNVLTDYLAHQPSVRKVYLINQDYAYGQAVQRTTRDLPLNSTSALAHNEPSRADFSLCSVPHRRMVGMAETIKRRFSVTYPIDDPGIQLWIERSP